MLKTIELRHSANTSISLNKTAPTATDRTSAVARRRDVSVGSTTAWSGEPGHAELDVEEAPSPSKPQGPQDPLPEDVQQDTGEGLPVVSYS